MARKPKHEEHVNHERWLVSYADFITLLFAFFTTLYAIGESDRAKAAKFITSINDAFHRYDSIIPSEQATMAGQGMTPMLRQDSKSAGGALGWVSPFRDDSPPMEQEGTDGGNSSSQPASESTENPEEEKKPPASKPESPDDANSQAGVRKEIDRIYNDLQKLFSQENLLDKLDLKKEDRGVVVSLNEASFFEPGRAELKSEGLASIDKVADAVKALNRRIQVDGHTDDTPIHFSQFTSNRNLSVARASNTAGYLIDSHGFNPAMVGAAGWGEFHPVADNATAEGRSRNRRVDMVILVDRVETPASSVPDASAAAKAAGSQERHAAAPAG